MNGQDRQDVQGLLDKQANHNNQTNISKRPFRLTELFASQKVLWFIAWVLGIATVLSVLGLVMLAGWFITMASVAGIIALGSHAFNYLMPSAIIRGFAIVRTFARYGDLMVSHHAVFGLLKDLRVRFFSHWARLPLSARMNNNAMTRSSGETMQRLVSDIDVLDEFPLRVVSPLIVASVAVIVLSLLVLISLPSAVMTVVCMALSLVLAIMTLRRGITLAKTENRLIVERKNTLLNTLPALTSLLTWGRWGDAVTQMNALDTKHSTHTANVLRLKRRTQAFIQLIIALAVVALLAVAGQYFEQNAIVPFRVETLNSYADLNPAIILALTLGVFGLMEIISTLVGEPLAYGRSVNAKERINELMMVNANEAKQTLTGSPTITLTDVSVKMPTAVMSATGINATLSHHAPTLIIGASGAGKSTLLATLAGEIPLVGGQIQINGIDYQRVDFGRSLGFLGQSVDIFDQSLADNLRLGKPAASDDELWAVLDKVVLSDWAKAQPKGLDTPLGEYGMAISGGQGRRVALARLLLSAKSILLLDEPFAGLDTATRLRVWQSLTDMQKQGDIGVLVIATHQLWDGMNADILRVG